MDIYFHAQGEDEFSKLGFSVAGVGDVNHDGFDDIAVVAVDHSATYIYYGTDSRDSIPDLRLPSIFYHILGLGDINGDGNPDVAGATGNEVWIFYGNDSTLDTIPTDTMRSDLPGSEGFGDSFASGDFDGDGITDFVIVDQDANVPGARTRVLFYAGANGYGANPVWSISKVDNHHIFRECASINLDSDSALEVVVGIEGREADSFPGRLWVFDGPDFDSIVDLEFYSPPVEFEPNLYYFGRQISNVGDFNVDGCDDLGARAGYQGFIFFGGTGVWDSIPDLELNTHTRRMIGAGDVNWDGADDIFVGNVVYMAEDGRGELFLGGNPPDGDIDYAMTKSDLPPHFLEDIGSQIAAAGDFNGDDAADVILRSGNLANWDYGEVFVLGLADLHTAVRDPSWADGGDNDNVKSDDQLIAYPNPSNSAFTILVAGALECRVQLTIHNILGQAVATLEDNYLKSGEYNFSWPRKSDKRGNIPSGLYFVRLQTSTQSIITKPIVLVK